jgi:hypothetical protein
MPRILVRWFSLGCPIMNANSVIVMGTLKADGTLELDERPTLTPGRVQVSILPTQPSTAGQPRRTLLDVLDEIRAAQVARGYHGRSVDKMQADEAARRAEEDEYEARWRTLRSQTTPTPLQGTDG